MSRLPPGWVLTTLEDLTAAEPRAITDGPFGSNLKSSHYVESGPRVIRLQNIGFGNFIDENAHITEQHFDTLRSHEVRGGDLVVASLGQDLPRACLVPPGVGPAIVKADCIRVRLHQGMEPRYVNYALQRPELRHAVSEQIHGVGRPRLGMAGIKGLSIPLAPRAEQERIVAAIEEHLSRLDAAETNLARCTGRTDTLRASAITEVLSRCEAPHVAWGDAGLTLSGRAFPSTAYSEFGCRLLRPGNLHRSGSVVWSPKASTYLPMSFADENPKYLLRGVNLLMNLTAQSLADDFLGRVCLSSKTDSFLLNQRIARLSSPVASSEYLYWVFRARPFRRFVAGLNTGSLIQHISTRHLAAFTFPLPSAEDQKCLVAEIEERVGAIDGLERAVLTARSRQPAMRRALLAAAFSGQLVPQDRGDEPASALLERIVVERAAAIPAKRKVTAS